MTSISDPERGWLSTLPLPPDGHDASHTAAEYFDSLAELARRVDVRAVGQVAQAIVDTVLGGRTVFVAGNGGSASTASHVVCDLLGTCVAIGQPHARIVGLSDNASVLTALANDTRFDEVFSQQLALQASAGDLLLLLSVSGESPNLLSAARTARARGMRVVAGVGMVGSSLAACCDAWVCFGSNDYGLTEDLHLALNHIVVRVLNGGKARTCRES